MYISDLIKELFTKKYLNIYDKDGNKIDRQLLKIEFNYIKNNLLNNFKKDDTIAIKMTKDYKLLLVILACMEIGLTYIPIGKKWPASRISQIKKLTKYKLLITDDYIFQILNNPTKKLSNLYHRQFFINNDILYIMFTSGTSGEPKGVKIKRESYVNFLQWINIYFNNINKSDKILNVTEFTFDVSLVDIGFLLIKRSTLFLSNFSKNIYQIAYELDKYNITTISTTPIIFEMILEKHIRTKIDLSSLKTVMIAGSIFSKKLYEKFSYSLPTACIYNCYGPTENTIYTTVKKIDNNNDVENGYVSIGKPITNTGIQLYDNDLNLISNNNIGEIFISGIQLMEGYVNKGSDNVFVTINNNTYYKTGDLAFKGKNGDFYITGRSDDTMNILGNRINLTDINSYILKLPYVEDSIVITSRIEDKSILLAFIILKESLPKKKIFFDLRKVLLNYQVPKYIEIIDDFPLNSSNKICKQSLQEQFNKNYYQ